MQVFVDPNRRYPRAELPLSELDLLGASLRQAGMGGIVHVPYLANVATADALLRSRSIEMVGRALRAAGHAGLSAVVVHPGSHRGRGFEAVREGLVLALAEAARDAAVDVPLLLENTAGAGGHIGGGVAELRWLLDALDRAGVRCGLCLDLAHAHAEGWDLGRASGVAALEREWRDAGLIDRVALVHANDSRAAAGSHRDLHANPGEGTIGRRGLRLVGRVAELRRVPWILEVPGKERSGPRRTDVRRLDHILNTP